MISDALLPETSFGPPTRMVSGITITLPRSGGYRDIPFGESVGWGIRST